MIRQSFKKMNLNKIKNKSMTIIISEEQLIRINNKENKNKFKRNRIKLMA